MASINGEINTKKVNAQSLTFIEFRATHRDMFMCDTYI